MVTGDLDSLTFKKYRENLTKSLKNLYDIKSSVIDAMNHIPRHLFVPEDLKFSAYVDTPLSIGYNQTISAPHMVAIMCDLLDLKEGHKVLEIGAGSGYNAAIMSCLVGDKGYIYTIERISELIEFAKENLKKLEITNVEVMIEDEPFKVSNQLQYDRIVVTCAATSIPKSLIEQLKIDGLLVIPIGEYMQQLYLISKDATGKIHKEKKGSVSFVPLIGEYESYDL
ncbi:MAG: protein-L-isoaspartate O-methyltransferase [Methanosarcinaceae archaeon]|jgi:protein-L-isoaspartate(D-aspartate) O-methyltransferase|nr:protein-L-isoaspartate O-methyltransferase [Methanosarcinaceae archaeon]NKQ38011.1 protein-L-isoaspartate O-methyltransferase [Methanosarcinales archaeon]